MGKSWENHRVMMVNDGSTNAIFLSRFPVVPPSSPWSKRKAARVDADLPEAGRSRRGGPVCWENHGKIIGKYRISWELMILMWEN